MTSWLCVLPLSGVLFGACAGQQPLAVGYVEGEYVLLAPTAAAQIEQVPVARGDRLAAGDIVAEQQKADAELSLREADAAWRQAVAQLDDLRLGKRPEEIAVLEATLASAEAQLREAQRSLERQAGLSRSGFSAQAQVDAAQTALEQAEARVRELEANLAVARLPARADAIIAAENRVRQSQAAMELAQWRLDQRAVRAPAAGEVADVILRPGEISGPSAPVVSFLPQGAVKLKLYLPEPELAGLSVGDRLTVRCDGCGEGQSARVSYIAPEPEFTPPVIYSLNNRQKLVYLVEARPEESASRLKPGQIVDVVRSSPETSR
jgi:HlyD family secretion protein